MADLSLTDLSTGAAVAQIITTQNTNNTALEAKVNNALVGGASGSGNNLAEDSIYRVNIRDEASPNVFVGEIIGSNAEIREGGTVAKSSGLVYSIADGTFYVLDTSSSPDELYRIRKTSIANDSVVANRDTYFDIGTDGTIDKTAVGNDATAPAVGTNHARFAKVVSSAEISAVTMLGNTTFQNVNSPKGYLTGNRVVAPDASASAATTVTLKSGLNCRDGSNTANISLTSDVTAVISGSGAGGLDTGAESASTWYHLHIIDDSTESNTPKAMFSKSSTAPTLPSGYDKFRRVPAGARYNDGSSHLQNGATLDNEFFHTFPPSVLVGGSSTAYVDIDCTTTAPSTAVVVGIECRNDGDTARYRFRKNGIDTDHGPQMDGVGDVSSEITNHLEVEVDTGQIFEYKEVSGGGSADLDINVYKYKDTVN